MEPILLDPVSLRKVRSYFDRNLGGVTKIPFEKYLHDTLSFDRSEEAFALLEKKSTLPLAGKKLLEIGSGFGTFVLNAIERHGVRAYGAEPEDVCCEVSRGIFIAKGLSPEPISRCPGEALPYQDGFFDIVYSSNVLEHVRDPGKVLSEALRVLKPGGTLFFVIPNYGSWWEGHYGLLWLPNMPKALARVYVRIFGRDPGFIDTLQFISLAGAKAMARDMGDRMQVMDWGWDIWEQRLTGLDFSGWAELYKLKKILAALNNLKILYIVKVIGRRLGWLTPIIMTAKKRG